MIWLDFFGRSNDSGLLSHKEHLPVRALTLGDISRSGSEAAYRVGPLQCYGDSKYLTILIWAHLSLCTYCQPVKPTAAVSALDWHFMCLMKITTLFCAPFFQIVSGTLPTSTRRRRTCTFPRSTGSWAPISPSCLRPALHPECFWRTWGSKTSSGSNWAVSAFNLQVYSSESHKNLPRCYITK